MGKIFHGVNTDFRDFILKQVQDKNIFCLPAQRASRPEGLSASICGKFLYFPITSRNQENSRNTMN
jgi:hypothetical protein